MKQLLGAALLLTAVGCGSSDTKEQDTAADGADDSSTTADAGPTPSNPTGSDQPHVGPFDHAGALYVYRDGYVLGYVDAHPVADDLQLLHEGTGMDDCWTAAVTPGSEFDAIDAGDLDLTLSTGAQLRASYSGAGGYYGYPYEADFGQAVSGLGVSADFAGSNEVNGTTISEVVVPLESIQLTLDDYAVLNRAQDLPLHWSPTGADRVVVSLLTDADEWLTCHLVDDGSYTIPSSVLSSLSFAWWVDVVAHAENVSVGESSTGPIVMAGISDVQWITGIALL